MSLLLLIAFWAFGLVLGFGMLFWGAGTRMQTPDGHVNFFVDLYMSGTTLFTLGIGDVTPTSPSARAITVLESGIGYVQPFDRRILADVHIPTGSSADESSDDRRVAALENPDDASLEPPLRGLSLDACEHAVAVHRLFDVGRRHIHIRRRIASRQSFASRTRFADRIDRSEIGP